MGLYNNSLDELKDDPHMTSCYIEEWKNIKRMFQEHFSSLHDNSIPSYTTRERYEFCLAYNDYMLGTINDILRRCTTSSIKQNEDLIRHFYLNVCKFDSFVVDLIMFSLVSNSEPTSYVGIFAEFPNSFDTSLMAAPPLPETHVNKEDCIKLYIHPSHTKEDVKWFIDYALKKCLPDNAKVRKDIRIPTKGFVERMLIGRMSFGQHESSKGIENTLAKITEKDENGKDDLTTFVPQEIELIKNKSRKKYAGVFDSIESDFYEYLKRNPEPNVRDIYVARSKGLRVLKYYPLFELVYSNSDNKFHLKEI